MKENRYDDPIFFEKYSHMPRSEHGLEAAGEWEALQTLLPDFAHKRMLDLGCGYGWHCIYALEHGAAAVTGVDISEKMLAVARKETGAGNVSYIHAAMEDVDFPDGSFDVVLSSLALHYVEDYVGVVQNVHRMLRPGGVFLFSCEHPVFTAEGSQDWTYNPDGSIAHFPVDNYYYEGRRTARFLGEEVTKYHRTLTTYLMGLLQNGFAITAVAEPMPPQEMWDIPGMKDEMRRPMMLIIRAVKQ